MTDFDYMLEGMTRDLAVMLMERRKMPMTDALDTLYNSETYEKLSDPRSGLYFQAPGYVYDFLDKEIEYGRME
ncbi:MULTISPECIES: hypothetical protein [Prevotella]|jgi:hypothetical protein|uniref:Uncharacterized protein n=1 Tax=Prevotella lacticifex TaxID=2854755 RepID=A0A9R1CZK2_9BACT|nr:MULTISPECIES: hypothetical protein [Prevotella]MDD6853287.1 hypothetical protein [Prevotella sp.]MDY6266594.1 hypothetical protein [Prevotella sp.]GJG36200.1 hypothetical protein PRLR5003_13570 [Prevotella lacticifex]GJG36204.1 hypothetical protein PRLR5003_13610 [Prevotella lacticifex]GJG38059.1 hypothetical protein PRLR5019_00300 [Prevotella lacticifex]